MRRVAAAERAAAFKRQPDLGRGREKRQESLALLRRNARAGLMQKRRREYADGEEASEEDDESSDDEAVALETNTAGSSFERAIALATANAPAPSEADEEILPGSSLRSGMDEGSSRDGGAFSVQLANALLSDSHGKEALMVALRQLRQELSRKKSPPIDATLHVPGLITRLVSLLGRRDDHDLQLEVAWILTNLASGTEQQCAPVLEAGTAKAFVELLASPSEPLREQCVMGLGNIAADSAVSRDTLIALHAAPAIAAQVHAGCSVQMARNVAWALSNLCRRRASLEQVQPILLPMWALLHHNDKDVCADICWGLSFFTEGSASDHLEALLGLGDAYTRLVQVLAVGNLMAEEVERQGDTSHKHHWRGMLPTVRTLANLTASEDPRMLQAVLDAGVLPELNKCLMGLASKRLKKEACWLVSMVAAGEPQQRELLVKHDMLATLVFLIEYAEYDVVMEACFAFTNFLHGATPEQINTLVVDMECIEPLCNRLESRNAHLLQRLLGGLMTILYAGCADNSPFSVHAEKVEECGGLDLIDNLQLHENTDVACMAEDVMAVFFAHDEDEDDQAVTPAINRDSGRETTYAFGMVPAPNGGFSFLGNETSPCPPSGTTDAGM